MKKVMLIALAGVALACGMNFATASPPGQAAVVLVKPNAPEAAPVAAQDAGYYESTKLAALVDAHKAYTSTLLYSHPVILVKAKKTGGSKAKSKPVKADLSPPEHWRQVRS